MMDEGEEGGSQMAMLRVHYDRGGGGGGGRRGTARFTWL